MISLALAWWTRFPVQLRRVNRLLSEAWIDGVYLTAWPLVALVAPLSIFLLGLFEGATHWTVQAIPNGYVSAHVVDFTQMVPLLFIAAICGALSAQLGLLLVIGFALGDFFIAPPTFSGTMGWNLFHVHAPQLICYLAFFLLSVTPALTAKAMAATLPRWLQRNATPYMAIVAVIACAVQGVSVYAWTLAAPMIVRVHWLWAGQTPPFAVFDFSALMNPSLPIVAMLAMAVRFGLTLRARGKLNTLEIVSARREMTLVDRRRSGPVAQTINVIGSALVTTALICGLFDSVGRGLVVFAGIAGLFWVRLLVLPKLQAWAGWFRIISSLPLVLRWSAAILATFGLTRWVLSHPSMAPGANAVPGAFGVEIVCFLLGLMICFILLPVAGTGASLGLSKPIRAGAKALAWIAVLGLVTRPVFAGICLDPFCCFGNNPLVGALVVAALILMLPLFFDALVLNEAAIALGAAIDSALVALGETALARNVAVRALLAVLGFTSEAKIAVDQTSISEREQRIISALRENGITDVEDVASHLRGVDINQPVFEETLLPGKTFDIWVRDGGQPGMYATPSGTDPGTLGIETAGRHLETYELGGPLTVTQSTANNFPTGSIPGVGGAGGGQQYILPPNWRSTVQRILM